MGIFVELSDIARLAQRPTASKGTESEHAITLCQLGNLLIRGTEEQGDDKWSVNLHVGCPQGGKPIGLYHCIPSDERVYIPGHGMLLANEAKEFAFAQHESNTLVAISTGLGGRLTVTPNHPVMTPDGWKAASLIRAGDKLLIETDLPCKSNGKLDIISWQPRNYWQIKHHPSLPDQITPELSLLCGLLWSDGHISKKSISFCNTDVELCKLFSQLCESLFNISPRTYVNKQTSGFTISLASTEVSCYFTDSLGFSKHYIPQELWKSPIECRQEFIRGVVLGDGSTSPTNPSKPNDLVTSISVGLDEFAASSLAYFLATMGIKPRIRKLKQSWEIRNADYIRQVVYQSGNHQLQGSIPRNGKTCRDPETGRFLKGNQGGFQFTGGRTIGNEVKVTSVETLKGEFTVYDFYMPDYENKVYAGSLPFITHNTHPGGYPEPSAQDIAETKRLGLLALCVNVPETGITKCVRV